MIEVTSQEVSVEVIDDAFEFIDLNRPYKKIRDVTIYESDLYKMPSILSIDLARKLKIRHNMLKSHIEMFAKTSTASGSNRQYQDHHYELRYGTYCNANKCTINYIYFSVVFLIAFADHITVTQRYSYWRNLRNFTAKISEVMAAYLTDQLHIARVKEEMLLKQISEMRERLAESTIALQSIEQKRLPAPKRIRVLVSETKILDNGIEVVDDNEELVDSSGNLFKDALLSKGCHLHVRLNKLNYFGDTLRDAFSSAGLTKEDFERDGVISNMSDQEIENLFDKNPILYSVMKRAPKKVDC